MICERAEKLDLRGFRETLPPSLVYRGVTIEIVRTGCHLGGSRPWFLCPYCGRRCLILYPTKCRLCAKGRYAQELRSVEDRRLHRAFKWRKRLGQGPGGIIAPYPPKPKWMRWHTYLRLRRRSEALELEIWKATPLP